MKKYNFSLDSVLRARRAQEDVARQRLAAANHRLQQAHAAYEATLGAYRAMTLSANPVDRDSFLAGRAHAMRLAEAVERARRAETEVKVEAAMLYSAWVEAGKRVASLERLDERRRGEWEAGNRREEEATVDDVVASRRSGSAALRGLASGRLRQPARSAFHVEWDVFPTIVPGRSHSPGGRCR